jgi:ubiquinone biosynthesis protein
MNVLLQPWLALLNQLPPRVLEGSAAERKAAMEELLRAPEAPRWRRTVAQWVTQLVPVEFLVPRVAEQWRPLVRDSFLFIFSRLSAARLAAKVVEQMDLPAETPPEARLLALITRMPGLQKIGQVLARNRRLDPALRKALSELENGMSDVSAADIQAIVSEQLGSRMETYAIEIDSRVLSEASVSAVIRFSWRNPARETQDGVFKVMKPFVPVCFGEDMKLLQKLGEHLTGRDTGYGFAINDVREMITEVRLLLEHELDFVREQSTLRAAARMYRSNIGIRVPRAIPQLSTPRVTAMSAESGVKVTDAFPGWPIRRTRIAGQVVEALIAAPLFSRDDPAIFHADPHAGNLLYDEAKRELVVLDWALAERLTRKARRHLILLPLMTMLRNREGVCGSIDSLRVPVNPRERARARRAIARLVDGYFANLPAGSAPGVLDAMTLLEQLALQGVRFPAPLFLFRKIVFTLDGVLHDIAGPDYRIDQGVAFEFLSRLAASFGLFHAPLRVADFLALEWQALLFPLRLWRDQLETVRS